MPARVMALNRVDLPTLGKPTIPHFMEMRPFLAASAAVAELLWMTSKAGSD
jgi:hypothetical protein